MNKIVYIIVLVSIATTTLSQTVSFVGGDHQFYESVQDKCAKCHGDIKIQLSASSEHSSYSCTFCHTRSEDNHTNTRPVCQDCHSTAQLSDSREAHPGFANLGSEGCIACHTTYNVIVNYSRPEYIDYTITNKNGDWIISDVTTTGELNLSYNAMRQGGKHNVENLSCKDCHQDIFDAVSVGGHAVVLDKNGTQVPYHNNTNSTMEAWCRTCHDRSDTKFTTQQHSVRRTTCEGCHQAYNLTPHPGNFFTNINTVPHLYRSLVCISCHSVGWPAPTGGIHFKVRQEPYFDVEYKIITPLSITNSSPDGDPTTEVGTAQTFSIALDRTADVTWYKNGSEIFTVLGVTLSGYTNSNAAIGVYNITAIADDGYTSALRTWNWTVNASGSGGDGGGGDGGSGIGGSGDGLSSISGYVFDNYGIGLGGVTVKGTMDNITAENTTIMDGYYSITNMSSGTYNFSFSKAGFDTGYFEFTFSGGVIVRSMNMTIFDTTPPDQVIGLRSDNLTNSTVNLSWDPVEDANYYQVFRNYDSLGYTRNTDWNDTGLIPNVLYQYVVRANDSYNNWGQNSSVLTVNMPLTIISWSPVEDPTTTEGTAQTFEVVLNKTADVTWYVNDSIAGSNSSIISANYTNSTAGTGVYNITVFASDGYNWASRAWNWTVIEQPRYNLSGYVFDNHGLGLGDVLVQNSSYQNMTLASGYYSISNLSNGTYNFSFSKAGFDTGYFEIIISGSDNTNENINIYDTTPPDPVSSPDATTGNFFINNTWVNPEDIDLDYVLFRYNNDTTLQNVSNPANYLNLTWMPHYTQNISAQTVDIYGNINQTKVWFNATIPNNAPVQVPIGDKIVTEGELLTFNVSATDADSDPLTYGTNATKGIFNTTTGEFSWIPGYEDAGIYIWYFNSSDGYGGVVSETITVTVNDVPLSAIFSSPVSDPITTVGTVQTFEIDLNRTADVTWYIDGSAVQSNLSVISANYTDSTAGIGVYNITAIASDSFDSASRTWNWTVIAQPTYNVSGYVFDNYGTGLEGVLVQNGSYQNTTIASGYYLITGLPNGTYYLSYSKAGFDTSYLEVTVSGTDITDANITIYDTTPPGSVYNPGTTTGNFFINNTWVNPEDTDFSYIWFRYSNDTTLQNISKPTDYINLTWQPHYTQNISAQTVDTSGNVNQTKVWFNTTIPNNAPVQLPIGDRAVNENDTVTFTVTAIDADNDIIIYGTNATKGSFNTITGEFSWQTTYSDSGTYVWYFNSSDGYDGVSTETITVTVNETPLSITSSSPLSDPTTTQGTSQSFSITLDRTANVTWYMNGAHVQINTSITSASYTNSTAGVGTWNVTAVATDNIDTASRTWNWTTSEQPAYNVSGYVFDNYGSGLADAMVQNGSIQNITVASGYYLITGLLNGTYNFSYSKDGFNTDYLEVTVNGADITNVNITIYDTTPPAQVTGLRNDTPTQTTVNISWDPITDASYYQVFRNSDNLGYTQNTYWNDTGLTADTLYQYEVRANDSYNNWGQNSSILSVKTTLAADTTPPGSVSNPGTTAGNFFINNTWINPENSDFDHVLFRYSDDTILQNVTNPTNYLNLTWQPHYTQNISAQTVDTSGNINQTKVWFNATIPNNVPIQLPIGDKIVTEGDLLTFNVSATDSDSDPITYGTNATGGSLNPTTGEYSWQTSSGDSGTYIWYFNSSDGYGGVASETITITVTVSPPTEYIPPDPVNLANTQENFWINYTWQAGAGNATDSYNINVNGIWTNGTTSTYSNNSVGPHGWSNITVWAYNNSGSGSLSSASVSQNTQVANNIPIQETIGDITIDENQPLQFTVIATDADSDLITYGTNATKGIFNTTTGEFSWTPGYEDAGVYIWYFSSSDSYGGIASETITVTVNDIQLSITSSLPLSDPTTTQGEAQSFSIILNRTADIAWYINGAQVQINTSVTSASYTNSTAEAGTWNVTSVATDNIDTVSRTWDWNVNAQLPASYIPPDPTSLQNTTGNFWVNHTWNAGSGNTTDSYNVSVNGIWYNGTIDTFKNTTTTPHGWVNITVWAYNSSGTGSLSTGSISQNTQVPNNPPVQSTTGNKIVDEGQLLTFTVSATDVDNDTITYGTNATKGSFNTTTGEFSWTPGYGDAGVYIWYFSSSDGYGGIASETITITVNNVPLSITSSSPVNDPATTAGTEQTFEINLNRNADVTWYIDGSIIQINSNVASASYTNSTADIGVYNVTVNASDSYDSVSRTWNWTIIAQPTYSVSGYVFDNNGVGLADVLVQNSSYQSNTIASGYYLITGLINGTYNFSYSKAGFNTDYLEVVVSGADNTSANKTIYDNTPPVQVTGLRNDTPTQTTVNLSWDPVEDASYYQVFRDSASLGYTQNTYWNDNGLIADTLYEYMVRANDSYNNWGQNSSNLSVRTAQAADTTPPASVSSPGTTTGNFYINNTWTNPEDADFSYIWFKYSNGTTLQNVSAPINYLNLTWSPHYTQNISAQTVDTSGNVNQTRIWFNATIPNNVPLQSHIGNKVVDEGQLLSFTVSATDADNDTITYGTNATKGTFNTTTGEFLWTPDYGDAGVYTWYFNSSDGYGGVASETITVTVNDVPLAITSSSPDYDPTTTNGTVQTFEIMLNRAADVTGILMAL